MHLTLGILRTFQAFFYALSFLWLDGFAVPAPAQVTQAVGQFLANIIREINMASVPDHIKIKLENAAGFHSRIKETCLVHIDSPKEENLKRISVYIGEMAQSLRSALNNSLWDFCENKIKGIVDSGEYNKIKWSHDFPIESDKESFEKSKSRALRHIAHNYEKVYQFLETIQPYHKGYDFLGKLKVFSNDTSHTIPVKVQDMNITQMVFPGFSAPVIRGNEVIIQWSKNHPASSYPIPSYVDEMTMYISTEKKWKMFLMTIDGEAHFSPTPFSKGTPSNVSKLIAEFYALW
ncbi:MAG: hypothetical protein L6Q29_05065 [Candidatus Pacebacteria bacterium]|nr:hypothetical protein [Candidatus Paceibacterota bacterium]